MQASTLADAGKHTKAHICFQAKGMMHIEQKQRTDVHELMNDALFEAFVQQ